MNNEERSNTGINKPLTRRAALGLSAATMVGLLGLSGCDYKTAAQRLPETWKLIEKDPTFVIFGAQQEAAKNNSKGYEIVNAGVGNPDWFEFEARRAYARFTDFVIDLGEESYREIGFATHLTKKGISKRFDKFAEKGNASDVLLQKSFDYCEKELGLDRDEVIAELGSACLGDFYSNPHRCISCVETIVNDYLCNMLYKKPELTKGVKLFPTEGGAAGATYLFQSLHHNRLINPGDIIAIGTPNFQPYLEIPYMFDYDLQPIMIEATNDCEWEIAPGELDKLKDPRVKLFVLANPGNPSARSLKKETIESLADVVEANPDIIVVADEIYAPLAEEFTSVFSVIPHNTILMYSYSKLYGATGWRLGVTAIHEDNVVDRLLKNLADEYREFVEEEYAPLWDDLNSIPFIDRMLADSRAIGFNEVSGLATPAQAMMAFFSLGHLAYDTKHEYQQAVRDGLRQRYEILMKALHLEAEPIGRSTHYYVLVNMYQLARANYDEAFASWLEENITGEQYLMDLAAEQGVLLCSGVGYGAPESEMRFSLASLTETEINEIARRMFDQMDEYKKSAGL